MLKKCGREHYTPVLLQLYAWSWSCCSSLYGRIHRSISILLYCTWFPPSKCPSVFMAAYTALPPSSCIVSGLLPLSVPVLWWLITSFYLRSPVLYLAFPLWMLLYSYGRLHRTTAAILYCRRPLPWLMSHPVWIFRSIVILIYLLLYSVCIYIYIHTYIYIYTLRYIDIYYI